MELEEVEKDRSRYPRLCYYDKSKSKALKYTIHNGNHDVNRALLHQLGLSDIPFTAEIVDCLVALSQEKRNYGRSLSSILGMDQDQTAAAAATLLEEDTHTATTVTDDAEEEEEEDNDSTSAISPIKPQRVGAGTKRSRAGSVAAPASNAEVVKSLDMLEAMLIEAKSRAAATTVAKKKLKL
jgi:hypothetical protein